MYGSVKLRKPLAFPCVITGVMRGTAVMHDIRYMPLEWAVGPPTLDCTSSGSINCEEAARCHGNRETRLPPATGPMTRTPMKHTNSQNEGGTPGRSAFEIGVIRVFANPGPDAEDRLRRLMSLIVRHATRDGQAGLDKDSPSDAPTRTPATRRKSDT